MLCPPGCILIAVAEHRVAYRPESGAALVPFAGEATDVSTLDDGPCYNEWGLRCLPRHWPRGSPRVEGGPRQPSRRSRKKATTRSRVPCAGLVILSSKRGQRSDQLGHPVEGVSVEGVASFRVVLHVVRDAQRGEIALQPGWGAVQDQSRALVAGHYGAGMGHALGRQAIKRRTGPVASGYREQQSEAAGWSASLWALSLWLGVAASCAAAVHRFRAGPAPAQDQKEVAA